MPKKVTLKDIAAKAGLSPASVSMILNRRSIDRFNTETIKNVFALADSMGYKNSKHQSYALIKPSDTLIIIICPSLFNPFYTTIIQGIEIAARKQGFVTSVRTTYWDTDTPPSTTTRLPESKSSCRKLNVVFCWTPGW